MSNVLPKINLFISYSHDDEPYFKEFSSGLKKVVKNSQKYEWKIWDDTNIHVGTFWDDEIQSNIKECNIALLLVSVGFMSSKYIKEKEYNEFIKRYEEKGILIVPVVFCPCDFTQWEDLAKLQFFKPNGSLYGKPKIENFTYADLMEFNKNDGVLIPNPNINRYHLDLVYKIENSFSAYMEKNVVVSSFFENNEPIKPVNKLSAYPKISNLFTGRLDELKKFKDTFDTVKIFAVEGLGGIGKTQFIAKCIEEFIIDKNKIIWLNGSVQSKFDVFVDNAGYGDVLKGEKKSDIELYSGLKDLIEKDERIIFLDNFNDYDDIAFSNFLSFAFQHIKKATIILITKVDPSINGIISLPIVRLEGLRDDAIKYAIKLKQSNENFNSISDSDLLKICKGVEGHPLAIELSMLLMRYGKSANDIMLHLPEYTGIKKVEEFSKRLFLDIFNHPNTSIEERECFLKCSVFKEKISLDEINFINDGNDVFYLLVRLIDKLLVTFKDGHYEIHPLVRSFSYEMLSNKVDIHKKAANYFINKRERALNFELEEKIFYHLFEAGAFELIADSIEELGDQFISQGQFSLLYDFMTKCLALKISRPVFDIFLGDIFQIKGEWETALNFFKSGIKSPESVVKTQAIIMYGEILYRRGDVKDALPYFENALDAAKKYQLEKEEARAINDIGLVDLNFGRLERAIDKFNTALKIRIRINDEKGVGTSYNNLAITYLDQNKFDKALSYHDKSIKIAKANRDKCGIANSLNNIASVLLKQKKYEEALLQVNLGLEINKEIGDKSNVVNNLNTIAVIYSEQGRLDEALSIHLENISVNEEIGNKRSVGISLSNIGSIYFKKKNYELAVLNLLKSYGILKQVGFKKGENSVNYFFNNIVDEIGIEKFKVLIGNTYAKMDSTLKEVIKLNEIFNEPQVRESPKIGRNDPCPCGSSKKFKNCHGANK